jgi:hypothetical protein
MHAAENKPQAPPVEQQFTPQQPVQAPIEQPQPTYDQPQYAQEPQYNTQPEIDIIESEPRYEHDSQFENPIQTQQTQNQPSQEQTGMVDHFAMYEEPKSEPQYIPEQNHKTQSQEQTLSSELSDEQNTHNEMLNREMVQEVADEIIVENFQNQNHQNFDSEIPQELQSDLSEIESQIGELDDSESQEYIQVPQTPKVDVERYNDIISTKLITLPKIESNAYFVDSSNLGEITTQGELFYLTPTDDDLNNDNLNYVIPMGVSSEYSDKHNYIVNSANDFFLLQDNQKLNLFINLSYIDESIKEMFLIQCLKHAKSAYVVCQKQDITLVEEHINKLSGVFVKDLESADELYQIETNILTFEKNYLMRKFN